MNAIFPFPDEQHPANAETHHNSTPSLLSDQMEQTDNERKL